MNAFSRKTVFGIIVSNRAFFNAEITLKSRAEILSVLDSLGYGYVIPDVSATPTGCLENRNDAKVCADLFYHHKKEISGIIVILPNFGDEVAVVETIRMAQLDVPILVQASNDEVDKVDIHSRRDAFCGKISVCNNLYQYGIPFTDTSEHTCDITGKLFRNDIIRFAAVCRVVNGLKNMRVGLIGSRPPAFRTVRFSEKMLQRSGITTVPVDLSEILAAAKTIDEKSSDFVQKLSSIKKYGKIPSQIPASSVIKQACLSLAIDRWCEKNEIDATAIQCWNSLEENYGCAPCLSMSMMGEAGRPSACEADVCGAVSMYALSLACGNAPALLDWNNNYAYEENLCVNTHCSNYPKSFMGSEIEVSNLDLLGNTLGADRCFGAVKGHVGIGPMTFFRISTDETKSSIKAYLGEGDFVDRFFPMDGGIAVCSVPALRKLLKTICANGFEHHVAMVRSHTAGILYESVSKYLQWKIYWHNGETEAITI